MDMKRGLRVVDLASLPVLLKAKKCTLHAWNRDILKIIRELSLKLPNLEELDINVAGLG